MSDRILRIDMTSGSAVFEPVPEAWAGLGGRGLTSAIVAAEVPPTCHPLGKQNKLVFAPGLLSGTRAANSGRLSAGAKSPLTGTIKESNAGGTAARMLALMGIKAIIVEGMAEDKKWFGIHVSHDKVRIAPTDLGGLGNFALVEKLGAQEGEKAGVLSIGPAGEMRMASANISVKDPQGRVRSLGRGGLGAVMGSKGVKYISIDPGNAPGITYAHEEAFKEAAKVFAKALTDHPVSGQGLPTYGTNILLNVLHEAGGLPTRNFRTGSFDGHEGISGETMHARIEARGGAGRVRHACHPGCLIQCSQVYPDKEGKVLTSGFEYESIWAMGANCAIDDLDSLAEADRMLDDLGMDTIEFGVTLGVAMEAGLLPFGDAAGMLRILKEDIATGSPLGRLFGAGAACLGKAYGMRRVPVVKGQAIPAYDPRSVRGMGITYATSTMGADHTAGYTVATNILNVGGSVDPLKNEGQMELSRNLQIATAAIDSTGLCLFVAFPVLDIPEAFNAVVDMLNARFGLSLTGDDVSSLGSSILKMEREFNRKAGFNEASDRLPEFFSEETLPPHNTIWDVSDAEMDTFWNF
ncbi:aldehyde ferredoxin oxidoreductase family protein [Desulfobotulus sp.]|uniref:aldehyde ferredoxin oxidoreductase family protein n=1 Tax=Desulfobotulus sp. TaxID=1940337 RepID=UPI002A367E80|nr:aldehyde ferredoxin oxidoreductase C-terminal domain-containing protein [Desulfobotulus sp.]MDY0161987.1 aldehyde ferredoxin oxidoreductase C-terminal domain-containing protein [Desulfobotulus sp.]